MTTAPATPLPPETTPNLRYDRTDPDPPYPHMTPDDVAVWREWLAWHWHPNLNLSYDLPCSCPWLRYETIAPDSPEMAELLKSPRADVVISDGSLVAAVEIKPELTPQSIGQALTYSLLLAHATKIADAILPVVICRRANPELVSVANQVGVAVWLSQQPAQPSPNADRP